jgi:hypothetical protein
MHITAFKKGFGLSKPQGSVSKQEEQETTVPQSGTSFVTNRRKKLDVSGRLPPN